MFSKEMIDFLIKVITSWEIIVVTVALILFFTLVSYVARVYHPSHFSFDSKPKKVKKEKAPAESAVVPEGNDDDDLGIDEE
jgi:hypothetical protein